MKTINLLHSKLPLPADGPLPDFADFLPGAQSGEDVGGKIPFFLRGSVILLLLLVGLGLVGAGVYRFLISPLDFSGTPRPVAQESPVAMKAKPAPPTPTTTRPVEEKQTPGKVAEIPSASPVSPAVTDPVSKTPPPSPPKKPPAETVATALLPGAADKDEEEKPPSTVGEKEAVRLAPKTPEKAPEKTASVPFGLTASPKAPKAVEAPSETKKKASVSGVEQEESPPADAPPKPGSASQTEPAEKKETPPQAEVSAPAEKKVPKPRKQTEAPPVAPPKVESPSKRKLAAVVRTDGYSVQVGACETPRCVQRFLENVKNAGFTPHTKKSANRKLTLIRVGSYKTVAETKSAIQRLKAKGFKGSYAVKQ